MTDKLYENKINFCNNSYYFFFLGIFVSINKLFPFNHLKYLKNNSNKILKIKDNNFSSIEEIGKYVFENELINEKYLISKSINSIDEINKVF